ncbi:hypothetical protein [Streptomyces narbonensis]
MTFAATVFIGTSLDGYIARSNDDIEWLTSRGEKAGDLGFFNRARKRGSPCSGRSGAPWNITQSFKPAVTAASRWATA